MFVAAANGLRTEGSALNAIKTALPARMNTNTSDGICNHVHTASHSMYMITADPQNIVYVIVYRTISSTKLIMLTTKPPNIGMPVFDMGQVCN